MSTNGCCDGPDEPIGILSHVRRKGVKLWADSGRLRYRAPKGALTPQDIESLQRFGERIVTLLENAVTLGGAEPKLAPRQQRDRAPLSFTQLTTWNSRLVDRQPGVRQIASAVRLRGRLDVGTLRESLAAIVRRHEALRTRIVPFAATPVQLIDEVVACELMLDDLTSSKESVRDNETRRRIDELVLCPVDVAAGGLLAVRLVRLSHHEHVVIVAMEHVISDAFSLNIFLRDLLTAYGQLSTSNVASLQEIPVQFADYATWQQGAHACWLKKHAAYWDERLRGCGRMRFPQTDNVDSARIGWGRIPLRIGLALKAELVHWSRLQRTTLVMSVFTAFAALVLRWCNVSDGVIRYQIDGRAFPGLDNTIGYFASILNLRCELRETDSFVDLLNRSVDEYCRAYEHADFGFLDTRSPPAAFAANSAFNWVSQEPSIGFAAPDARQQLELSVEPVPFDNPVLRSYQKDGEPVILLYDTNEAIEGGIYFPRNRFSEDLMERFARNFMVWIKEMMCRSHERVVDMDLL